MHDAQHSVEIASLSPTQYEWLRRCPLHVALDLQRRSGPGRRRRSDAQRLGDVIHGVMRHVVEEGHLAHDHWQTRLEAAWAAAVATEEAADPGAPEPAVRWADYEEKRQRTIRLADRIRQLMLVHGREGFLPEQRLEGRGGRLKGIADLVVRTPTLHAVIDYKTGAVASEDGSRVKDEYERQLRLYACLEQEASGSWPDELAIYPLKGAIARLSVTPETCERVADEALEALDEYNAWVPGPQQGRPGSDSCPRCEFAPSCQVLWTCLPLEGIAAASGVVAEVFLAERGSTSVVLEQSDGQRIEVLSISPVIHPAVASVKPGDAVGFIGITETSEPGFFRLPRNGMLGTQ